MPSDPMRVVSETESNHKMTLNKPAAKHATSSPRAFAHLAATRGLPAAIAVNAAHCNCSNDLTFHTDIQDHAMGAYSTSAAQAQ